MLLWAAAALFLVLAVLRALQTGSIPFDLRIYREAAHSFLEGAPVYHRGFGDSALPFTYPPFALLPLLPLAMVPERVASWAWFLLTLGSIVASVAICLRATGLATTPARVAAIAAAAAVVLQPYRSTLELGQINLVLLALVLTDAFVVPRRSRGWLIGAAGAIKLTPLVFLAWLLAIRDRRSAVRGVAAFGMCTAVAWVVLPSASLSYWTKELFDPGRMGPVGDVLNQSWNGVIFRLVGQGAAARGLWIVVAGASLLVGFAAARRLAADGLELASLSAMAIAGLLASPVSWPHHWVWILPAVVAGWAARRDRRGLWHATVALGVLASLSPWRMADTPVLRDAFVVAGAWWLLAALRAGRGAHTPAGTVADTA